jgi:hypothetical protein
VVIKRLAVTTALVVPMVLALATPTAASWLQQDTPVPPGGVIWGFSAVSCTGATACMAVGTVTDNTGSHLLAERLSGATWTVIAIPDPGAGQLGGISCTSPTACTAVGDFVSGGETLPLAETWDGTSWAIHPTIDPGGSPNGVLNDVSCTAANACEAVGSFAVAGATQTLAERWDGSNWSLQAALRLLQS